MIYNKGKSKSNWLNKFEPKINDKPQASSLIGPLSDMYMYYVCSDFVIITFTVYLLSLVLVPVMSGNINYNNLSECLFVCSVSTRFCSMLQNSNK